MAPGKAHGKKSQKLGTFQNDPKSKSLRTQRRDDFEYFNPLSVGDGVAPYPDPGHWIIIALDLLQVRSIHGVRAIRTDFLSSEVELLIQGLLEANRYADGNVDIPL